MKKKDLMAQGYEHAWDYPSSLQDGADKGDEVWRSPDKMKYYRVSPDGTAHEFVSRGVE